MLLISKRNGVVKSQIVCDKCNDGWQWAGAMSISRMECIARQKGWKMGKQHICDKCRKGETDT